MKIKYKTTIYNKKNPFGVEKTRISEGNLIEKPSYLTGPLENCIFLKNQNNQIAIIEKSEIIKIF